MNAHLLAASLALLLFGGTQPCAAQTVPSPPSIGAAQRQTVPPPRFESDCMKTNVAPSWVHARQPQAIVVCPPNCASADRSVLGGDGGIYQRDSSICRAAIHAGVVNASGGEFTLYYQPLLRSWNSYYEGWCLHTGSLAHGIESLAVNSTNDEAFTFNATGGYVLCSHLGAEPKPTGGTPAALLAAVREFNISCDRNDADGALVDIYYPLALVTCPANCSTASARVYGSGFYECGSSVCQAAIHAGVLTDDGGTFWLNNEEGQVEYVGSSASGVTSLNASGSGCSFDFNVTDHPWEATCDMRGMPGSLQSALLRCPSNCGIRQDGISVCGSGPYNSRFSNLCSAAVHSGVISNAGGVVLVHLYPGLSSYKGSVKNGYESGDCGGDGSAIIFEAPPENPVGSTTAMLGGWKGTTLATFNATLPAGELAGTGDGSQSGNTPGNHRFNGT